MPTPLEAAARAASRRMRGKQSQLGNAAHPVKSMKKKKPQKQSKRERVEHGESPRGRVDDF